MSWWRKQSCGVKSRRVPSVPPYCATGMGGLELFSSLSSHATPSCNLPFQGDSRKNTLKPSQCRLNSHLRVNWFREGGLITSLYRQYRQLRYSLYAKPSVPLQISVVRKLSDLHTFGFKGFPMTFTCLPGPDLSSISHDWFDSLSCTFQTVINFKTMASSYTCSWLLN